MVLTNGVTWNILTGLRHRVLDSADAWKKCEHCMAEDTDLENTAPVTDLSSRNSLTRLMKPCKELPSVFRDDCPVLTS